MSGRSPYDLILFRILMICGIFLLSACGRIRVLDRQQDEGTELPLETPQGFASPTEGKYEPMTPSPAIPTNASLNALIEKARADLASRLNIVANEIVLVEATSVIWPDGSLGCPQPGMAYIQVPQDGLLIRLQIGDQIYEYHSGGIRDPFLCVKTGKDPTPPPQIDIFNLTPNPKSTAESAPTPDSSLPPDENQ